MYPNRISTLFKKIVSLGTYKEPKHSEIGTFLLHFRDPPLEYKYLNQPDYMLKYSVLLGWFCAVSLVYMQLANNKWSRNNSRIFEIVTIFTLSMLLFLTWYKKICFWRYSKESHLYSNLSCSLFQIADFLQHNLVMRICVYMYFLLTYILIVAAILVGNYRSWLDNSGLLSLFFVE